MTFTSRVASAIQDAPELTVKEYAVLLDVENSQKVSSAVTWLVTQNKAEYVPNTSPKRVRMIAPVEIKRQRKAKPAVPLGAVSLKVMGKEMTLQEAKALWMSLNTLFGGSND